MKRIILFSCLVALGCKTVAPDISALNGNVGQPMYSYLVGCEVETQEEVLVEVINGSVCGCKKKVDGELVDIPPADCQVGSCDEVFMDCGQQKFVENGLDNTYTHFADTNQTLIFTDSEGNTATINVGGPFANFSAQIAAFANALDGFLDTEQIGTFCTSGCGGLPQPIVAIPNMKVRYVGYRTCPGDAILVGANYASDQRKELPLDVSWAETEKTTHDYCIDCNGNISWIGEPPVLGEDGEPICFIKCVDDFKETPEPACESESEIGYDCYPNPLFDPENEDNEEPEFLTEPIVINIFTCDGVQTILYGQVVDGEILPYNDGNGLLGEWTDENCTPVLPECPVGLEDKCFKTDGGFYEIMDNSTFTLSDGSILNHLQNGNNYELTLIREDGTTVVVQQDADPYFNNLKNNIAAATGCTVLSVCANHTSRKGCSQGHVDNLAMYPAYDPPTGDVQNNLNNPAQSELWATGWLIDCDCGSPFVRVEITGGNNHVGAYKELIPHVKEPEIIYKASDGCVDYYKDCYFNPILPPSEECKLTPCNSVELDLSEFKTTCGEGIEGADYGGAIQITVGRPNNAALWELIDNRDPSNNVVVVSGNSYQEFSANAAALGYADFTDGPSNEAHYFCPCPPGLENAGDYFIQVDGNTSMKPPCTPSSELSNFPEGKEPEQQCALQTKLCEADIQAIADAIGEQATTGLYQYCVDGKPVVFCIDGKDLTFYQDGVLLNDPVFHKCECPQETEGK